MVRLVFINQIHSFVQQARCTVTVIRYLSTVFRSRPQYLPVYLYNCSLFRVFDEFLLSIEWQMAIDLSFVSSCIRVPFDPSYRHLPWFYCSVLIYLRYWFFDCFHDDVWCIVDRNKTTLPTFSTCEAKVMSF